MKCFLPRPTCCKQNSFQIKRFWGKMRRWNSLCSMISILLWCGLRGIGLCGLIKQISYCLFSPRNPNVLLMYSSKCVRISDVLRKYVIHIPCRTISRQSRSWLKNTFHEPLTFDKLSKRYLVVVPWDNRGKYTSCRVNRTVGHAEFVWSGEK